MIALWIAAGYLFVGVLFAGSARLLSGRNEYHWWAYLTFVVGWPVFAAAHVLALKDWRRS